MKTLLLIRHAQFNPKPWQSLGTNFTLNQLLETTDNHLTPKGIEQAKALGKRLSHLNITAIHCSSLIRTQETAKHITSSFRYEVKKHDTNLLWESLPSRPQNPSLDVSLLPIEEFEISKENAAKAYQIYFQNHSEEDKTELIICHGNLIKYFTTRILGLPITKWTNFNIMNASITKIKIHKEKPLLISLNDTGHLTHALETST